MDTGLNNISINTLESASIDNTLGTEKRCQPGSMRLAMPKVAAFIDDLRAAFGKAEVDAWIRQGLKDGTFYAAENGHVIGKRKTG